MIRKGCVGVAAQQCVISRESSAGMSLMMVRWKSIKEGWSSGHFQGFFSVTQIHITWRIRPGKTWHDANLTPWNMTVKAWDLDLIMSHTYMYKLYFSILDLNTLPGLCGSRTKLNKDTEYVGKTRHCVCVCVYLWTPEPKHCLLWQMMKIWLCGCELCTLYVSYYTAQGDTSTCNDNTTGLLCRGCWEPGAVLGARTCFSPWACVCVCVHTYVISP